uniref:EF-hand domain-containing protein n=2 Tax=Emiliania huxleyi TaxID=2903 RepID=A0A7S3RRH0_EMIHU
MGRQVNGVTPERVKAAEAILPHLFAPPLPLSSIESRLAAASPPCHIPPVRSTCLPPPSPPAAITAATTAVEAAFKCFEESGVGSGHVTMAALERALTTYGSEKLPLADARALLSLIEPDSAGRVNYVDFVNMMTGT